MDAAGGVEELLRLPEPVRELLEQGGRCFDLRDGRQVLLKVVDFALSAHPTRRVARNSRSALRIARSSSALADAGSVTSIRSPENSVTRICVPESPVPELACMEMISPGLVTTPSAHKKPAAKSSSCPGVRIVTTRGFPLTRISRGSSTTTRSCSSRSPRRRTGTDRRPGSSACSDDMPGSYQAQSFRRPSAA